jgi:NitT/TauT family transport system permease protein
VSTDTDTDTGVSEAERQLAAQQGGGMAIAASVKPKRSAGIGRFVGPGVVFGLFIAFWYFTHHVLMSGPKKPLVPVPHDVLKDSFLTWNIERGSTGSRTGGGLVKLLEGLFESVQVAALGLAIAIVLGFVLATLMSQAKWVQNALWPFLIALQAMPILAFVPLIGTVIGFNFKARVMVCVIIAIFPDCGKHLVRAAVGRSRLPRVDDAQRSFPDDPPDQATVPRRDAIDLHRSANLGWPLGRGRRGRRLLLPPG